MIKQRLHSTKIVLLLFILSASFLFITCSKKTTDNVLSEQALSDKFFSQTTINDNDILNVAKQIKQKNDTEHFLLSFIQSKGYILWNEAEKVKSSKGLLTILPFAFDNGKEINGFIIARQDFQLNTTSFDVFTKNDLSIYGFIENSSKLDAQKVQSIVNYFNYKKFNTTAYKLQDIRQLPDSIRSKYANFLDKTKLLAKYQIKSSKTSNQSSNNLITTMALLDNGGCFGYWEETEWWWNPDGDACNCNGDEYYVYSTYEYISVCFDGGGGGYGGGGFGDGSGNTPPTGGGGGGSSSSNYDPNNPFNNLDNPIDASDDAIIDNGVSVSDNVDAPTNPRIIAQTSPRGNTEDMQHGTTEDPTGISPSSLLSTSDADLFQKMKDLFHTCTYFDNDLSTVGDAMIQKFQNKSGGQYSNNVLNSKVAQSSALINFVKAFGEQFNASLQIAGGNINNVSPINMQNIRPIFNGLYNKFHGLQILINDTEYTEIQLDNFTIDGSGNWSADITITIHDHFGLDKNDALTYQNWNQGFPAWWLLQHTRDYIPFETIVVVRKKISSHI
jgi:hypothetical protein